ncbi:cytochrome D1 domain-containing protein [Paludibaculum fermentans]|uniref:Beta-propeller fold lactonase family protein n=1 Tax=Paludibaculum fermentans TaxID=1473598 RepID=A0A7S7NQQ0_PALFE|nr:cytochrome D1 domain-containing protein [Paludibaculum fermentans]QOY88055.1 beta-propeller fold lactonase family protein [Paludibaculum fermentans]
MRKTWILLLPLCVNMALGQGGLLLVANKGDQAVAIIDPKTGKSIAAVPEGGETAHELVASPDGRVAYAPIYGNSGVGKPGTDGRNMVVVDLKTHKVTGNVDFGKGIRPHCPVIGPKNGLLYVTTELDNTITVIDPKSLKIVGTVPTGQAESHMLAISRDGKRGYTANVGPGTVSVLDLDAKKTVKIIPISRNTQRIALSVDDKLVFTSDQTAPRLAVIDAATNTIKSWVDLPAPGYGTAPTPDGKYLVVAVSKANKVAVVDLGTMKVTKTIDVPAAPQEVLVRPDGKVAYVSCDSSKKVAAIRTSDWSVEQMIEAGKGADGLAWAGR